MAARHLMERTYEATIEKCDNCYIGWVDDVPGAFSQGKTLKEVQKNLVEAVQLILETQSELTAEDKAGKLLKKKIKVQV
jgi:predicted RNase H-like HicB family nuclease